MKKISYLVFSLFLFFSAACTQEPIIPLIPAPVTIAVAPFNQPTADAQLLAGYIPSEQGYASAADFEKYNAMLHDKLMQTNRRYVFLTQEDLNISIQKDSKNRPNVLATWAKIAQNCGADYIIVPQILEHQHKKGKGRDVFSPARLITDIYLIQAINPNDNSADGFLQARSHYKEISFVDVNVSGEDYVTPRQQMEIDFFVKEAINKMIREFHLSLNNN